MRSLFAMSLLLSASAVQAGGNEKSAPVYDLAVSIRPADRFISVNGSAVIPPQSASQTTLCFELAQQMKNLRMEVVSPPSAAGLLNPKMISDNGSGSGNWSAELSKPPTCFAATSPTSSETSSVWTTWS